MRHQFLPTGRVQYFPMCVYEGDGRFVCKVSGKTYTTTAARKFVDATFLNTTVPSTHTPNFKIADGVSFMPLNDLPKVRETPDGYVVIGAGKTGIDACLWLLEQRVDPDKITWIISRDSWFLNRRNAQMSEEFFFDTMGAAAGQMESIAHAESPTDMFDRLEACGYFIRLDQNARPSMFHGATMSVGELDQLRRIKNTVRMGRVQLLSESEIVLENGTIATTPNTLHVDCSASAIGKLEDRLVFDGDVITPQTIRPYQPVFSAAFIAHVELTYEDQATKNQLCGVVPLPDTERDFIRFTFAALMNQKQWRARPELAAWISDNRLDGASRLLKSVTPDDEDKIAVLNRIRKNAPLAAMRLLQFMQDEN